MSHEIKLFINGKPAGLVTVFDGPWDKFQGTFLAGVLGDKLRLSTVTEKAARSWHVKPSNNGNGRVTRKDSPADG